MRPLHPPSPDDRGRRPPAEGDVADDLPLDDDPLLTDETPRADLDALVDEVWADDDPVDEVLPAPSEAGGPSLALDEVADDEGTEIEPVITQEAPLPARAHDPVVLPWRSTAYVDGEPVPAVADPGAARTTWTRPGGAGRAVARLRVAGVVLEAEVDLSDGRQGLRIGRDVLAGRFWIEVL